MLYGQRKDRFNSDEASKPPLLFDPVSFQRGLRSAQKSEDRSEEDRHPGIASTEFEVSSNVNMLSAKESVQVDYKHKQQYSCTSDRSSRSTSRLSYN